MPIAIAVPDDSQLDEMIALMADVFDLPLEAARSVFYRDPSFRRDHKLVAADEGVVAACLTLVEDRWTVRCRPVGLAGIAGVATRPECERRGYASALMMESLGRAASQGIGIVGLVAERPGLYQRLGWRPVDSGVLLSGAMPGGALPGGFRVRNAVLADLPEMADLFDSAARNELLARVRDLRRWRFLLNCSAHITVLQDAGGGGLDAYAIYTAGASNLGDVLRVLEAHGRNWAAVSTLIGHLQRNMKASVLDWLLPAESPFALLGAKAGLSPQEPYQRFYARVASFSSVLSALCHEVPWVGGMELVCRDAVLGDQSICIPQRVDDVTQPHSGPSRIRVEASVSVWTQALFGVLPDDGNESWASLKGPVPAISWLRERFPRVSPFLSRVDHF